MRWDVIVVGAGPGGSSAAYHLAKAGLKVLLLEKHKLPRPKLCAGCLSGRIESLLPEGWNKLVLNTISGGTLGYRGEEYTVFSDGPVAYIVDRSEFDSFLACSSEQAGATLVQGVEVLGVHQEGKDLVVKTTKGDFMADFVVGADGFYSKVARSLGFRKEKFFRSVEFFTEGDLKNRVIIDIGIVQRGYAWVFPKGDAVSVGVASTGRENLLKVVESYSKLRGYKFNLVKGWHIPYTESPKDVFFGRGKVLLVGDAANLVDPLLGEGIYYAVLSGRLASHAIVSNPSDPIKAYISLLKDTVKDLMYAGFIAKLGYRYQGVAFKLAKQGSLERYLDFLKGKHSYKGMFWKGLLPFIKGFF
ncbi:geranylgeranyl reductase family protein [Thermocrinis minervae]|uniref:Geranylgeranyl reductase family n=1 Tax=Thermocrinis minervae TaxID=381751 RepID=A0A1M6S694_9AQUI|nr:geranylgeranyl reductase family protein [Thermocrinis minervae]SHK40263.1 geranylgeranyl reductase family [Thermocrinis minervae]